MEKEKVQTFKINKLFRLPTFILVLLGLGINILLSKLMLVANIPLFMDSWGTVLVAAVCGYIPGIFVGFLTNVIISFGDHISLYYGILNILIAVIASYVSRKGILRTVRGSLICVIIFTLIGGGLGSVMTWLLYGFEFGSGISASFAVNLYNNFNLSQFGAQFIADMAIDFADKFIIVAAVFICLKLFPQRYLNMFPLGYIYDKENKHINYAKRKSKKVSLRQHSLRTKIVSIIVGTAVILSGISLFIGLVIYREKIEERYKAISVNTVNLMLNEISGDKINDFLRDGETSLEYRKTESALKDIYSAMSDIQYMYVYQIQEDGCHVVFDLDTNELKGETVGTVIPFDPTFEPYLPKLLAGKEIEPIVSNDQYGWLLTVYKPILNSEGVCVAYAAADVDMHQLETDSYVFFIRVAALLFAVSVIIIMFVLWYAENRIVIPINNLSVQAKDFAYSDKRQSLFNAELLNNRVIKTGDEIEELSLAMSITEQEVVGFIEEIKSKALAIERLQINTIHSFANMVESRDKTTGNHIVRTAEYVRILGEGLLERGLYPDIIDSGYVKMLVLSAPLHDIGKIGISDTILNKPGKLTAEEFDTMKTHTTIGQSFILASLKGIKDGGYLAMASDMSAYHHEKWDGSGYPQGLSGESIPLCARIMAVADVFDALLSKRSYKEAFSFEKAVSIITEERGKHFDPILVDIFTEKQEDLRRVALIN